MDGTLRLVIGNRNYSSWSLRPWLLLRSTGLPFEEELLHFGLPDWKRRVTAISPARKVPVLLHRLDGETVTVWESLAICEYVARLVPEAGLWPEASAAFGLCAAISSEMHAGFQALRRHMPMNVRKSLPGRGRQPGVAEDIARIAAIWGDARGRFGADGPFLLGRFSVADAMYAPVVFRFATYDVELGPVAAAYRDTMLALPAMREWAALSAAEPWIVPEDEVE
jgi:glutathione S-transferase